MVVDWDSTNGWVHLTILQDGFDEIKERILNISIQERADLLIWKLKTSKVKSRTKLRKGKTNLTCLAWHLTRQHQRHKRRHSGRTPFFRRGIQNNYERTPKLPMLFLDGPLQMLLRLLQSVSVWISLSLLCKLKMQRASTTYHNHATIFQKLEISTAEKRVIAAAVNRTLLLRHLTTR